MLGKEESPVGRSKKSRRGGEGETGGLSGGEGKGWGKGGEGVYKVFSPQGKQQLTSSAFSTFRWVYTLSTASRGPRRFTQSVFLLASGKEICTSGNLSRNSRIFSPLVPMTERWKRCSIITSLDFSFAWKLKKKVILHSLSNPIKFGVSICFDVNFWVHCQYCIAKTIFQINFIWILLHSCGVNVSSNLSPNN